MEKNIRMDGQRLTNRRKFIKRKKKEKCSLKRAQTSVLLVAVPSPVNAHGSSGGALSITFLKHTCMDR